MLYNKLTKTLNDAQDFAFMKSSQNIIDINNSVEQTDASILIISWWYNINEKVGSQWNHCVIYGVNPRIQSEYKKTLTRNNSVFGHFSCSECYDKLNHF